MKRKISLAIILAVANWLVIDGPLSQVADSIHSHGSSVGAKAPGFTLKDKDGKEHALAEFQNKAKFVALVFYRSADWWPYCQKQLVELQSNLKEVEAAGIAVVGISYDSPEVLQRAASKHQITFPLLSDEGSKTIDAYGIRNQEATGRFAGIPHPATFVVDDKGVIRAKLFHEGYKERHTSEALIQAVKQIRWGDIRIPLWLSGRATTLRLLPLVFV
jgi:peroxiredoxin